MGGLTWAAQQLQGGLRSSLCHCISVAETLPQQRQSTGIAAWV